MPVRLGERLVGFLQTGQVFRKNAHRSPIHRTARLVAEWGVEVEPTASSGLFRHQVLSAKQHDAVVKLLSIFAQHISIVSNQILVQRKTPSRRPSPAPRQFIQENQSEDLSLGQVAKAVNTSTFYFCKMFKKSTGINFTDYVSRLRIEKAKKPPPQPQSAHQRNRLRGRFPVPHPFQPRLQENHRPVAPPNTATNWSRLSRAGLTSPHAHFSQSTPRAAVPRAERLTRADRVNFPRPAAPRLQ